MGHNGSDSAPNNLARVQGDRHGLTYLELVLHRLTFCGWLGKELYARSVPLFN
jgi:hypothetical protein